MAEKKYYEGYLKVEVFITYGVHAESRDEAYEKISEYITEESIDLSNAEWDSHNNFPDEVYEELRPTSPEVINIDEEDW